MAFGAQSNGNKIVVQRLRTLGSCVLYKVLLLLLLLLNIIIIMAVK